MSIKTSNTDFKTRIRQQIEDPIMRKTAVTSGLQKPKKTLPATFYRLPNAKMPGRW